MASECGTVLVEWHGVWKGRGEGIVVAPAVWWL